MAGRLPDTRRIRSNGAPRSGWRSREFGNQCGSMRELGDQGAENERVETWRAEQELSPLVIPLAKCDEPAIRRVAYPTTSGQWLQNPRARFPKTGPENKFTNFL